jgi:hypothetical protein
VRGAAAAASVEVEVQAERERPPARGISSPASSHSVAPRRAAFAACRLAAAGDASCPDAAHALALLRLAFWPWHGGRDEREEKMEHAHFRSEILTDHGSI